MIRNRIVPKRHLRKIMQTQNQNVCYPNETLVLTMILSKAMSKNRSSPDIPYIFAISSYRALIQIFATPYHFLCRLTFNCHHSLGVASTVEYTNLSARLLNHFENIINGDYKNNCY